MPEVCPYNCCFYREMRQSSKEASVSKKFRKIKLRLYSSCIQPLPGNYDLEVCTDVRKEGAMQTLPVPVRILSCLIGRIFPQIHILIQN